MALRIFETDPDARPKARQTFSDDTVGRFHSGISVDGLPKAISEWRVTTGDPEVAAAIAELFGGTPEETDSTSENFIQILTEKGSVLAVLDGPEAIYADMKLWNRNKLVHHCDGVQHLSPEEKKGRPCGCPELFAERKQAANDFMGPAPSISVTFRLADDTELGKFRFQTGSWSMAEVLHEYDAALSRIDGPALCELTLEHVEYETKKGRHVSYFKPVIRVIKSHSDAIADPR
ncbi:hypothetical protein P3T36_002980 [Kitasatospora sp. MAP12-15]|uniref:recombination directionality factor n=1 Tax=unclassified Kitasatospora TaxID=2633591 RepID=UPI0024734637|nr:hypothetical protein [Kitasatospora sp. MAP12-44]MDH6108849.1 hypothetical protein [Kitasatospora sp. MAP12-44]